VKYIFDLIIAGTSGFASGIISLAKPCRQNKHPILFAQFY